MHAMRGPARSGHNDYDGCVSFSDKASSERTGETVASFPRSPNNYLVCVMSTGGPQYLGGGLPSGMNKRKVDTLISAELLRLLSKLLGPVAPDLVARYKTGTGHCRRSCLDCWPGSRGDEHRHGSCT
jgi:hypothetical protein